MNDAARKRIVQAPLSIDARGSSVRVIIAADKYTVANVSQGINDREEYARLFSAAPDMLAALQGVLPLLEKIETARLVGDEGCLWPVEFVRAAIAKAEGETS